MLVNFRTLCLAGLLSSGLALVAPSSADADLIATESFSYPDGSLYGANGGTGWLSIWTGNGMAVSGGEAVTDNFGNPPKYGSRMFDNPGSTNELFVALDLITPAAFGINDYMAVSLSVGVNNNLLDFGKYPGSNLLQVGNVGTPANFVLQPSTTYRLIGAYSMNPDPGPDLMMLWINPTATDYFDVVTRTSSADAYRDGFVAFHAFNLDIFGNLPGVRFDNILISNTAAGVGLMSAIPEPAGFSAFLAVLAAAGSSFSRKNRVGRQRRPGWPV